MATATQELIYRIKFDPTTATADTQRFAATVQASLRQVGITEKQQAQAALAIQQQTEAAKLRAFQQSITQISREEQRRVSETVKAANQRLREEQRTAREVARITAETARQATTQEKIRERSAKQLADVQIREAKRAARELERSLAASRSGRPGLGGGDITGVISSIAGRLPVVGPQISGLTSEIAGLTSGALAAESALVAAASGIALFVAGAGAGIATVALLGKAIFDTAKEAAQFQGKFFDLSQQVGVAVETLSTLDVIASTTGGNIETVTASMGIFQKGLENAHDPTSKEAKLLKELGVTSLDTEAALRQTLSGLFKMGEGAKQTDAVLQLFGRSGRFVNAILKESQGDLDAATKKFSEMGLIVSTEAAAGADQFNDSLEILNRQIAAVTRGLVGDAIPVFTVFFQNINQGLTGNKDDWSSWSNVVKVEVAAALGTIQGFAQFVASLGTISLGIAIDANIRTLLEEADKLTNKLRFEADAQRIQRLTQSILAGKPGDRPDSKKADSRAQAQARANKDIQLQQQALEETTRRHRERLDRERELDLKSIDELEQALKDALFEHQKAQQAIFDQEAANIGRFIKGTQDRLLAERELAQKRIKLNNDTAAALQKVEDEAQRRRDQVRLSSSQRSETIRDEARRGEAAKIKADLDDRLITETHAIDKELALLKDAHEGRLLLIKTEIRQITTSTERKAQLLDARTEAEQQYTNNVEELTRRRIDARNREIAAETPPIAPKGIESKDPKRLLSDADIESLGPIPPPDFSLWKDALRDVKADLADFGSFASNAISEGIRGIAGALAEGVVAWALYGESIGVAMKKALAASAARVAGEALFQGALHAAYALGSLAFGDFSGAARHGIAAAKFFAIGAAAAIAARAIAGNTFRQGATGGGGAGPSGQSSPPGSLNTIVQGRNQQQTVLVVLRSDMGELDKVISASVVRNIGNGGDIREAIHTDGR